MQTLEYRFTDKAAWGEGEWQAEPDKKQWQDEATGLPCLIKRGPHGALCGYVGVAEGHPLYGKDYDEASDAADLTVHGGLTYAAPCEPGEPEHGICHRPDEGEPDHVWWFGFDCAHGGDLAPRMNADLRGIGSLRDRSWETYRTQGYVEAECADLARQLAAVR